MTDNKWVEGLRAFRRSLQIPPPQFALLSALGDGRGQAAPAQLSGRLASVGSEPRKLQWET